MRRASWPLSPSKPWTPTSAGDAFHGAPGAVALAEGEPARLGHLRRRRRSPGRDPPRRAGFDAGPRRGRGASRRCPSGGRMKVATWNVNSIKVRLPSAAPVAGGRGAGPDGAARRPRSWTRSSPAAELEEAGYHAAFSGQRAYNGVALLSRQPAADVVTDLPGMDDPQRRVLGATVGGLRFLNLYVPNGQSRGLRQVRLQAWSGWAAAGSTWRTSWTRHERLVVCGRLQRCPGGPGRSRPGPVGGLGPLLRRRTGKPSSACWRPD